MATKLAGGRPMLRGHGRRAEDRPQPRRSQGRLLRRTADRAHTTVVRVAKPTARAATQLRLPLPLRWRRSPMQARDVFEVLDALSARGVRHWVIGGWGVDALLGAKTRDHDDLDLAIGAAPVQRRRADVAAARRALEALGYRRDREHIHLGAWFPERLTYRHRSGLRIDLLPIDERPDEFFSAGLIDGREVACLSAETQLQVHTGYPRTGADRHDVTELCEHFELESPRPERKMEPGWR
jgi:lincosamide nucleotidyltransferase A/C/D/E